MGQRAHIIDDASSKIHRPNEKPPKTSSIDRFHTSLFISHTTQTFTPFSRLGMMQHMLLINKIHILRVQDLCADKWQHGIDVCLSSMEQTLAIYIYMIIESRAQNKQKPQLSVTSRSIWE